jgi:hypothetical protein
MRLNDKNKVFLNFILDLNKKINKKGFKFRAVVFSLLK